jgi:LPS export ABC transporter protein LptC
MSARALALLLVPLAAGTAACDRIEGEPVGEDIPEMAASQVYYTLHHEITVDGVREAVVDADSAYFFEDSTSVLLFGLDMRVYAEDGAERAHVTSRTGTMDTRTQAMVATGNAVVVTRGGARTIRTEQLHYDPAADRVWADVPFEMVEGGRTTRGSEFNADAEFRNIRVTDTSADNVQIEF